MLTYCAFLVTQHADWKLYYFAADGRTYDEGQYLSRTTKCVLSGAAASGEGLALAVLSALAGVLSLFALWWCAGHREEKRPTPLM